jgi:hypothetical protein
MRSGLALLYCHPASTSKRIRSLSHLSPLTLSKVHVAGISGVPLCPTLSHLVPGAVLGAVRMTQTFNRVSVIVEPIKGPTIGITAVSSGVCVWPLYSVLDTDSHIFACIYWLWNHACAFSHLGLGRQIELIWVWLSTWSVWLVKTGNESWHCHSFEKYFLNSGLFLLFHYSTISFLVDTLKWL